jgi:chromate reductase
MATPHNIAVLVGSIRKESFTLKIAKALAKLAPDTLKLEVVTLNGISFFNQDLEASPPADWLAFREKLQQSNGVLIVTPEYNRSISGVLKNAIDVGSRPYGKSSFLGAAAEKAMVVGFHFAFPSIGHVEKDGAKYRLIPAAWNPVI